MSVVPGCSATQIVRCRRNSRAQVTVAWFKAAFDKRYGTSHLRGRVDHHGRRGRREKVSDADDALQPVGYGPDARRQVRDDGRRPRVRTPRRPAFSALRRAFVTRIGPPPSPRPKSLVCFRQARAIHRHCQPLAVDRVQRPLRGPARPRAAHLPRSTERLRGRRRPRAGRALASPRHRRTGRTRSSAGACSGRGSTRRSSPPSVHGAARRSSRRCRRSPRTHGDRRSGVAGRRVRGRGKELFDAVRWRLPGQGRGEPYHRVGGELAHGCRLDWI